LGTKSVNTIDVSSPNANTILLNDANINKISSLRTYHQFHRLYIAGQVSYQGSVADTVVYGTKINTLL